MKNKLIDYFEKIAPLSPDEAAAIAESAVVKICPKATVLLREGQVSRQSYFVLQGLVRQYSFVEGGERTTDFFAENQWVISLTGAEDEPSAHGWVCEEETTLVMGNEHAALALFKEHPRLEMVARKVLENVIAQYQQRLTQYLVHTPEQRYLQVQESNPCLLQRIPQYHLASYIGVTPESLSRIRKRIASRGRLV